MAGAAAGPGTSASFPRCGKRLSRGGDPVWWGSQTSTGATREIAWKWRAPCRTRVRARACCKWRRYGFAWPTGRSPPTPTKNLVRSTVECPFARSRPRGFPTLPPFHAASGGVARSRPHQPAAGIPPQIDGIALMSSFVATTRPSIPEFRSHGGHAGRNSGDAICAPGVTITCWSSGRQWGGAPSSSAAPADSGFHPGTRTPRW